MHKKPNDNTRRSVVIVHHDTRGLTHDFEAWHNAGIGILCLGRNFKGAKEIDTNDLEPFFDTLFSWNEFSHESFSINLQSFDCKNKYNEALLAGILSFFVINSNKKDNVIIIEEAEMLSEEVVEILSKFIESGLAENIFLSFYDTYENIQKRSFIPKYEKLYKSTEAVVFKGLKDCKDKPVKLQGCLNKTDYEHLFDVEASRYYETHWKL